MDGKVYYVISMSRLTKSIEIKFFGLNLKMATWFSKVCTFAWINKMPISIHPIDIKVLAIKVGRDVKLLSIKDIEIKVSRTKK